MKVNNLKNQRGSALVVTLMVIVIMTVTVTEFLHAAWLEHSFTGNFRDSVSANIAVRSGVDIARAILAEDARKDARQGRTVDSLDEFWAQSSIPVPLGDNFILLSITDEGGKIDLNNLITKSGYPGRHWPGVFRRLLVNLDMDEAIADAVMDWIDPNDEGLAENFYYLSLEYPYPCKNGKLDSLEELKLIKGITPKIFSQLKSFVTISSSGTVNVNSAPAEVIMALDADISYSMAESLVRERGTEPFQAKGEIKKIVGFKDTFPRISNLIDVKSKTFSVSVESRFNDVTRRAEAIFANRTSSGADLIYYRVI